MLQYSVALDASTRRPSTSRVPPASTSSAASSSSGADPSPARGTAAGLRDRPARAWRCPRLPEAGSAIGGPVTVLPWADVALRIQRQPAQRAGRPPLGDHLEGPPREGTGP